MCRRRMMAVTTATVLMGTIIAFGISNIKQLFCIDEEGIGQHS
jgi:hypothetical protein